MIEVYEEKFFLKKKKICLHKYGQIIYLFS